MADEETAAPAAQKATGAAKKAAAAGEADTPEVEAEAAPEMEAERAAPYPEPLKPIAAVNQDNVTVPGIQVTEQLNADGTVATSSIAAAAEPTAEQAERLEAETAEVAEAEAAAEAVAAEA
jgi:hypothetical protein